MAAAVEQRNQDATCYVGNLEPRVTEELLWELFTQVGPVENVFMPRDKVTGSHFGYGFVEFRGAQDAEYATRTLNYINLYKNPLKVRRTMQDKRTQDVGAKIFIGNLDPMVDEKLLHDTFSAFGSIIFPPKIQRDEEIGKSRGCGFITYDSFEASDLAIQCMNGQYLCSRQITVQYAFKKEGRGERHGTEAERLLAKEMRAKQGGSERKPNLRFAIPNGQQAPPQQMNFPPPMMNAPPPLPPVMPGTMPPGMMYPPQGFLPPPNLSAPPPLPPYARR